MPAESTSHLVTAEELRQFDLPDKVTELIRGRLIVREPPGARHGSVAARLTYLLGHFVYRNELGMVFAQDTGFKIQSDPDTVRAPDVAFVGRARANEIPESGYAPFAPDLAAEIVSPNDRPGEVLAKVGQLLDAGTKLVWVIDPALMQAVAYSETGDVAIVRHDGDLEGGLVVPGFRCALAEVFR